MRFNSLAFLVFLPLFTLAYWGTRGRIRLWICLLSSYVFYAWWDPRFLLLVFFSTLLDFLLGIAIEDQSDPTARRHRVVASVVINLGFLGVFKYFNFFADSLATLLTASGWSVHYTPLHIILPVGISFYVFKTMSYTIDVYRRDQKAERDLLLYATFVGFFPELVAGPIVRASRFLPQLRRDQSFDFAKFESGLRLILLGFVQKVVIADSLAPLVDARFAHPETHTALSLLVGVYFYAFQIYCDFAGYSAIAIGVARTFGFDFGINFDRPYLSASFSEFWTRWHISLSSWLRDYLYIPLGGNRGGKWRTSRNLMLTMLLGGLWHGANWTFLLWGGLHGTYLALQRVLGPPSQRLVAWLRIPKPVWTFVMIVLVFHLTCLGWILFRAGSLATAVLIVQRIFTEGSWAFGGLRPTFLVIKGLVLIGALIAAEAASFLAPAWSRLLERPAARLGVSVASLWAIAFWGTFSGASFIYFQF